MGILEAADPAIVICTRDRDAATAFYRDVLGLALAHEDGFAAVFNSGSATVRISLVPDFSPHGHTILGFRVPNVPGIVKALQAKDVEFTRYGHISQDAQGIFSAPGGVQVAWFKDPDGNVLSVTNV